ncbi:hypothetical protein [Streptosporangium sp. NPDC001681]|uniref:hypothetical protein n=1 Tax=Streptosporangium sp. NPDC001681 TaxID=3154395 RepID=UPI00332544DD
MQCRALGRLEHGFRLVEGERLGRTPLQAALIPMSYFGQSLVPVLLVFYACLASTWGANLLHPR